MTDLEFITENVNKGFTIQTINESNLSTLDKLKFISLGGERYIEKVNKEKKYTDKEKYLNSNKMSIDTIHLVDTVYGFFDKFTESDVIKAGILISGNESYGKSGVRLFEGIKVKKEPYSNYFTFNIVFENGNITMDMGNVEKDEVSARIIRTEGYPSKDKLVCMLISPNLIEKSTFINDFGHHICYKTNFDVELIYKKFNKTSI